MCVLNRSVVVTVTSDLQELYTKLQRNVVYLAGYRYGLEYLNRIRCAERTKE